MISFRIDWFDLLVVQGTLKSLLQDHSVNASAVQCSAFFMVQLLHPYMTTGKITALTAQLLVGKVSAFKYAVFVWALLCNQDVCGVCVCVCVCVYISHLINSLKQRIYLIIHS